VNDPVSFWLDDADDGIRWPPLDGSLQADVAIVGAGYTGLWTAWYLLQREPTLQVVVLEAETVGFGASGRNGAWCSPHLAISPSELARRTSDKTARRTVEVMRDTVREVGRVCEDAGIPAQFRQGGILRIARGVQEVPLLDATWRSFVELDLADGVERLDADTVTERVGVAEAQGAMYDPHGATIHPGQLVRGLARAVEAAGGRIHEHSRVTDVTPGRSPEVRTPRGGVRATTVVLATEAWLSELPGWRRAVLPLYSLVIMTEPLPDDVWASIGWRNHETLSSHRYTVDYLSRTVDGRILFGGRGAPYHFGSRIDPAFDRDAETHAMLRRQLGAWFPCLRGVRITHEWGGPLGMPRDWLPGFWHDPTRGLAAAYGYTGQGVATTNLAGRVLADLIVRGGTDFEDLPMVGHRPRRWEPEPVRWAAVRALQAAMIRIDEGARRTGRAPTGTSLPERLIRH
jgi:glycine/D-amino acid oxidase-like deaminating enzyme